MSKTLINFSHQSHSVKLTQKICFRGHCMLLLKYVHFQDKDTEHNFSTLCNIKEQHGRLHMN